MPEEDPRLREIREAVTNVMMVIMKHLPICPERVIVLRKLKEISTDINSVLET